MILCIYYIFNDRIAEQLNIFFWKECRRRVKQWFSSNTCYYFNVPGNISSRKFDFYETMSCASSDMRVDKYTMKDCLLFYRYVFEYSNVWNLFDSIEYFKSRVDSIR